MGGGGSAGGGVKGRGVPLDMNDGRDAGPGSPFLAKMERLLAWALSVSVAAYLGYKYGFMEGARRGRNAAGRLGVGGEGARSGEGLERGPINGWDWGDSAGEGFGKGLEAGKAV